MVAAATEAGVVRVDDTHVEALAAFFRRVWDAGATEQRVRDTRRLAATMNCAEPGVEPPTFLLLADGEAIGHVTTIPTRLWWEGRTHPLYWIKGLMVVPEHRNGPVGFTVLREAVRQLDSGMAMVVHPNARRLFEALGFRDCGVLPNFAKPLRTAEVIRRLDPSLVGPEGGRAALRRGLRWLQGSPLVPMAGGCATVALGLSAAFRGGSHGYRVTRPKLPDGATLDRLWERMRSRLHAAPARDWASLAARYAPGAPSAHGVLELSRARETVAVVAVRPPRPDGDPRLRGIRVATLSEVVCDPDDRRTLRAAVAAAESEARAGGADLLLCTATDPRLQRALRERAFFAIPGNVHLLVREGSRGLALPNDLSRWWLTRGDSAADETF